MAALIETPLHFQGLIWLNLNHDVIVVILCNSLGIIVKNVVTAVGDRQWAVGGGR
jgi:hypothetical protein